MLEIRNIIVRGIPVGCIAIGMMGCNKLPENVLSKDEMTSVLIDIHKGESVVEMQRGLYSNDSMKKVVKQSILLKHGITQAALDTSFVWYGNHIEDYIEIYEEVINRLEDELKETNGSHSQSPVFAEGDSIDVWPMSHTYKLSGSDGLQNVLFDISRDDTWKNGDNYTLQFKLINNRQPVPQIKAIVYARYEDGRVELRPASALNGDWIKVRLVTDSTRLPESIYGSISYKFDPGEVIYLDSLSLVRTRNRKDTYYERNGQRSFVFTED